MAILGQRIVIQFGFVYWVRSWLKLGNRNLENLSVSKSSF